MAVSMFVTTAQNVLRVDRNASVSKAQVAEELNVSQVTIWRTFYEQLQRVLDLMLGDFPARDKCCHCFVQQSTEHYFVSSVLVTDGHVSEDTESSIFTACPHLWAEEHAHGVIHSRQRQQFSINIFVRTCFATSAYRLSGTESAKATGRCTTDSHSKNVVHA
jgi:hypothetical protein